MLEGYQLAVIRKICGLTAADVGNRMFLSRVTISNIENGKIKQKSTLAYYNLWLKMWVAENLKGDDLQLQKVKVVVSAYGGSW